MTKKLALTALLASTALAAPAFAEDVTLTIESWRNDDLTLWQEKIIPAFEAAHPGIKLKFTPSAPAEYNAVLNSKLDAGSAGDLIACRPFDASLALYQGGKLVDLTSLDAMANFSDVAKSAWTTDDGLATFCVPVASVIHGFIYNKEIFTELGLEPPATGSGGVGRQTGSRASSKRALPGLLAMPITAAPRACAMRAAARV